MIGVKPILVGVFLSTLLLVLVALPTQANEYGKLKKAVALVKSEQLAPAGVEVTSFAEYSTFSSLQPAVYACYTHDSLRTFPSFQV